MKAIPFIAFSWLVATHALAVTRYVNVNSTNPVPPYLTWATAATNIQLAVDFSGTSDEVLVSNGVYATGSFRAPSSIITNRLYINGQITVRSVNGAKFTVIQGQQAAGTTNGVGAMRCVYLDKSATLIGFTITNGATLNYGSTVDTCGGGVYGDGKVIRCAMTGNSAYFAGGGAVGVTLINCLVVNNTAVNTLVGFYGGGGAWQAKLINCTVADNFATIGSGVWQCQVFNSIVYDNSPQDGFPFPINESCCAPGNANGYNSFSNAPLFVDRLNGNYRLQSNSPCINAGNTAQSAAYGDLDLDGNPRAPNGAVDIGAYEFQNPASIVSYEWLERYGLAIDGSADFLDSDGDGHNNWQEWTAKTDPTDASSVLRLAPSNSPAGVTLRWTANGKCQYWVERSSSLSPAVFTTIATNFFGSSFDGRSYLDQTATNGTYFYRLGVKPEVYYFTK